MKTAKNILVLSGSPRRGGNSDTLCDQFISGAREAGHETEKIFLRDKKINYCMGCGLCNSRKGNCSQSDDMAEILEKMIKADIIVMATPIYFYTMDGQMKTLIDRCCSRYTEITNKGFYFIMTAADGDEKAMERTIMEFQGFTYCLDGAKEKGIICAAGVWMPGDVKGKPVMREAFEAGKAV